MKHAFLDRPCTGLARIGVIALLLSLGTALLTGTVLAQPVYGGTLMVGLADDPPELDPHRTSSNASRTVLHNIFATLVEVDEDLQLQPELAHAWDVSDDGLVYTFHLRDDVLFHDGTRFDAEAVRYNFHRMTDPDFGSARAGELAFVTDVTVVDDFTVQVTLSQPFAAFLPALASWSGMMVSPTAAEEFGDDFSNALVGAGPFRFVERIRDDRLVVERFDDYFKDGLPYLDQVIYRPFVDVDARVLNLESGAIHIINTVPGKSVESLAQSANVTLSIIGGLGFRGIWVNTQSADLGSAERRAAVSACIDRQVIVDTVFGAAARPGSAPFSHATWVVDDDDPVPARDLERARELLAAAGVPDGFSFTLLITPDEESIRVASIMAAMCDEVGIDINIQQVEFGTILARMGEGNYTAAQIELSPRNDPDLSAYPWFHTDGGINFSFYSSAEMDDLLTRARQSTDQAERRDLYRESIELFNRDFPYIFTYHLAEMKAYRNEVQGYRHIPDSMMRFEDVWLLND
jgi:peptide/nickel transport system substrate-binding protein